MYDGSTACGEAMLMAHRADPPAARRCSRAACIRNTPTSPRRSRAMAGDEVVRLPLDVRRARGPRRGDRRRRRAASSSRTPDFFGNLRDLAPVAAAAHAKGALLIAVFTEAVSLGAVRSPGEMGADIVVGEGQSIGNALNFGGPYLGLFATRIEARAADAGPARRRDGRRRRPAQLRADAVDARAAHPPREGDEQHLHQLGPLRARLLHPSDAARRGRPAAPRRASITPTRSISPNGSPRSRASSVLNEAFFNEFTIRTPRDARGAGRGPRAARDHRRPAGFAACAGRRARRPDRRRRHRARHAPPTARPTRPRWRNACTSRWRDR